jgi:hypothetical protein
MMGMMRKGKGKGKEDGPSKRANGFFVATDIVGGARVESVNWVGWLECAQSAMRPAEKTPKRRIRGPGQPRVGTVQFFGSIKAGVAAAGWVTQKPQVSVWDVYVLSRC